MKKFFISCMAFAALSAHTAAQQTERLDRGVVAVKTSDGVYLSWRCLLSDDKAQGYDIYRDGVKVNTTPVTQSTNYVDAGGTDGSKYVIKAVTGDRIVEESKETGVWSDAYYPMPVDRPADGTNIKGYTYSYSPNDCSVGDVDGDGEYEIILKWDPSNSQDNGHKDSGADEWTGNVYLDCYKLDGTKLWRIDLGCNIRAGAHYTQFLVYDFDGDGKAEVICKTAPRSIDGEGNYVTEAATDATIKAHDNSKSYADAYGLILTGPEYLTVFNGYTGKAIHTIWYNPNRAGGTDCEGAHPSGKTFWGDDFGNRCERYLACVAHLDGTDKQASAVMCRGYYTRAYLWAVDFDGNELKTKWLHGSVSAKTVELTDAAGNTTSTTYSQNARGTSGSFTAYGNGNHNLSVADVDGDGCDEIIYGSAAINNDGSLLYAVGFGHGDAIHVSDLIPDRPGLEVFDIHEESPYGWDIHDAATGEIIHSMTGNGDNGRGLAADISADNYGFEFWSSSNREIRSATTGEQVSAKNVSVNFRAYWDGDLQDELLDGTSLKKWNGNGSTDVYVTGTQGFSSIGHSASCNSTKSTPNLLADILGDWREEVIFWDESDASHLNIFTTTAETRYRIPCLMQDHVYRMGVAWQNVAYNQPPHLGYYLPDIFSSDAAFINGNGPLVQSLELEESIQTITYGWKNATGVQATGLPEGVTMSVDEEAMTLTISGTPTGTGTYNFTIETTGGETTATLSGTITVKSKVVLTQIAYFAFDDISNGTTENKIYGQATAVGTPTLVEGKTGNAVSLDGTSYFIQEAYPQIQLGTKDFSIEFWFKSTDDAAYILHKGSIAADAATGTTGKWIGLEYKNGQLKFAIDDNVTKSEAAAATNCFNGEWNYVVLVRDRDAKALKMYVNGSLLAEATDNTGDISDNNEPLSIGNVNVNKNNFFNGVIDELIIYEGAMSAQKVAERYGAATGIVTAHGNDSSRLTIISAASGRVIYSGNGRNENIMQGMAPGIYIIITDNGSQREVRKIIKGR